MATLSTADKSPKANRAIVMLFAVIAIAATATFGLYAQAGSGSNTIEITPIVSDSGSGGTGSSGLSGVPVTITSVGEKYRSEDVDDEGGLGIVVSRIDRPSGLVSGNLIIDMVWSNSHEAGGQLTKPDAVVAVDLYHRDSDQREADDDPDEYAGDCTEETQREFKQDGVTTWLCPDNSPLASIQLSTSLAVGILGSNVGAHNPLYVLAHVPVSDDDDDDEDDKGKGKGKGNGNNDGSVNTGQIQQMEFVYTVINAG